MSESTRREFLGSLGALAGAMALPESLAGGQPAAAKVDHEPPLPEGVFRRLGSGRFRTTEAITALEFSTDSKFLLASAGNGDCRIWHATAGRVVATIPLRNRKIHAACWNVRSDYRLLIEDHAGLSIETYNPATGELIERRNWAGIGLGGILQYVFDPRGERLLATSKESTFSFDLATRKILWQQAALPTAVYSVDGRRILTTRASRWLVSLDAATGVPLAEMKLEDFTPVAYSHDGNRVLMSREAGKFSLLAMFDFKLASELWRDNVGEGAPGGFSFSADGRYVLYRNGTPAVWHQLNAATGEAVFQYRHPFATAAFSPDSKTLAAVAQGRIVLLGTATGELTEQNADDFGQITGPCFLKGHTVCITDRSLREEARGSWRLFDWNAGTRKTIPWPEGTSENRAFALRPDGEGYLSRGRAGLEFRCARADSPFVALVNPEDLRAEDALPVSRCFWVDDGRSVAVPAGDSILLVSATGENEARRIRAPSIRETHAFQALRVSGDGRVAATLHTVVGETDGLLRERIVIYDLMRKKARALTGRSCTTLMGLNKDGRTALFCKIPPDDESGSEYCVLDVRRDREYAIDSPHEALELSPDGRTVVLLIRSENLSHIGFFEIASQSLRWRSPALYPPASVAFSPDGRTLLSQHVDAPVYLWDVYGDKTDPLPKPGPDAWKQLGDPNGEVAFRTIRQLVQHPADAIALLEKQLEPAVELTAQEVGPFINELGHPAYRTREAAQFWLADRADVAAAAMRAAVLKGPPNPERQRRLEITLGNMHRPTKRILAHLRALEVLEMIHTAEAKALVAKIAGGATEAILTQEAASCGARMKDLPRMD